MAGAVQRGEAPAALIAENSNQKSPSHALTILGPAIFVSVLSFAATLPLRPLLLQQILGDAEAVSMMLARITASGALSEFIFNPLFGRASMLSSCFACPRAGMFSDGMK